jgi:hypothetical protein
MLIANEVIERGPATNRTLPKEGSRLFWLPTSLATAG